MKETCIRLICDRCGKKGMIGCANAFGDDIAEFVEATRYTLVDDGVGLWWLTQGIVNLALCAACMSSRVAMCRMWLQTNAEPSWPASAGTERRQLHNAEAIQKAEDWFDEVKGVHSNDDTSESG